MLACFCNNFTMIQRQVCILENMTGSTSGAGGILQGEYDKKVFSSSGLSHLRGEPKPPKHD